jgi:hypothetical protein
MMNPPPKHRKKKNSSANLPIYWEMSRGASGCMGMFGKSVEEIWRGVTEMGHGLESRTYGGCGLDGSFSAMQ